MKLTLNQTTLRNLTLPGPGGLLSGLPASAQQEPTCCLGCDLTTRCDPTTIPW